MCGGNHGGSAGRSNWSWKKNPPLAPTPAQLQWCFLVQSSKRIVIRKNQKADLCFAADMVIIHHSYNSCGSTSTAAHTVSMVRVYIMGISDAEELPTDTDRGRSRSQALFRLHWLSSVVLFLAVVCIRLPSGRRGGGVRRHLRCGELSGGPNKLAFGRYPGRLPTL